MRDLWTVKQTLSVSVARERERAAPLCIRFTAEERGYHVLWLMGVTLSHEPLDAQGAQGPPLVVGTKGFIVSVPDRIVLV